MDLASTGRLDTDTLAHLLERVQHGVVSRRQLLDLGALDHDLARLLRRRELATVHRGVYVNHTGRLTWEQRAWAGVLAHWPAALTRESALPGPPRNAPIQVAVDVRRTVRPVPGVQAHRTAGLAALVHWRAAPPRVGLERAVVDVAASSVDAPAAFQVLADACWTRRTTPAAVAESLRARERVRGRAQLLRMLDDLATGACSVLEREYLHAVERAHGLPTPGRQRRGRVGAGPGGRVSVYRDVEYDDFALIVELDGRAFHDSSSARDRDAERDLDAAALGRALTVRLTYGQVFRRPCATARRVAVLLRQRGWTGTPQPCPRCPATTPGS